MYFMKATELSTVNEIIKILADADEAYSVEEALIILEIAKKRIAHNSKIIYKEK